MTGLLILLALPLAEPLQVMAQHTQPPTAPTPLQWYGGPGPGHMWGNGYGWHFWWMPPMMMLFTVLVCVGVFYVLFARRPWGGGLHHGEPAWHMGDGMLSPPTHSALQILNERFARGEIQKDEYEDKKAAIVSGTQHSSRGSALV